MTYDLLKFADKVDHSWLSAAPKAFLYASEHIIPFLKQELRDQRIVFPPLEEKCFRAFLECSFSNLRVVILSAVPYASGQANGLCYDVACGEDIPPPLQAILRKIKAEYPTTTAPNTESYLGHLPAQGVLLLNMALSTRKGNSRSHVNLWRPFFDLLVAAIAKKNNIAWLQLGSATHIAVPNSTHFIVRSPHPSPAAGKDFEAGTYFVKINSFLAANGYETIIF